MTDCCRDRGRRILAGVLAACAAAAIMAFSGCARTPQKCARRPSRSVQKLSQYGLFAGDPAAQQPAAGVIPTTSTRRSSATTPRSFVSSRCPRVPGHYKSDDVFDLPVGTVIAKTFAYPRDARDPSEGAG